MSGYILYLLLGILGLVFWRARAGRTLDQLIEAGDHLHHQVLATSKKHPKGGDWAEHQHWMAEIGVALFLIVAGAVLGAAPAWAGHEASAGPFGNAACYVFGGRENCRTVRIFDAEECIIKVHPQPLPELDPAVAACLLDEVKTKMVYLRKARPRTLAVSDRVSVKGRGVVEVLVRYDDNGAAVWEPKNADTFDLKGDAARTRKAIEKFSSAYCTGESRMVGGGTSGGSLSAKQAYRRAAEGSIVLVDIRLASEWRQTGVGVNAHAITMHQSIYKFVDQLKKAAGADKRPIALICAEGVRSSAMQRTLKQYGFKGIIDVSEGMVGGKAGPGWIESGLPVKAYNPEQAQINR